LFGQPYEKLAFFGLPDEKQLGNLFIKLSKKSMLKVNHILQTNLFHNITRNFAVEREQYFLTT